MRMKALVTFVTFMGASVATFAAETINYYRFEEASGFLNDSTGAATLLDTGADVDFVNLPSNGSGSQFPKAVAGNPNMSAAAFGRRSNSLFTETTPVEESFTIELFAVVEDLSFATTSGDALMAGQFDFPAGAAATWADVSWAFHVELEGVDEPQMSLSLSDGSELLEYPSGIPFEVDTDYYLAASFDLDSNKITFHVQDLTNKSLLQTVQVEHSLSVLNPKSRLEIGESRNFAKGHVIGQIDEVRFSRGVVSVEDLLINLLPIPGDFDIDSMLTAADIDLLTEAVLARNHPSEFDLNGDGLVDEADRNDWVHRRGIMHTWFGDANLDGEFSSADFVAVFAAGKFETGQKAGWSEGDWNGDGVFSSGDFVAAFQDGGYERGARNEILPVPEPTTGSIGVYGIMAFCLAIRRFRKSRNSND